MVRAEQLIQLVERRMGGGQTLMYHGTSSKFLRTILKQGLIPDPREKKWDEDPEAGWNRPSRASYPGIYFSENPMTSYSAANNTVGKFGGDVIIIAALIQQRSALVDEDEIVYSIQRMREFDQTKTVEDLYFDIYGGHPDQVRDEWMRRNRGRLTQQLYGKWLNNVARVVGMNPRELHKETAWNMFKAIVYRKAAYLADTSAFFYHKDKMPTPQEGERVFKDAMDNFIHRATSLAVNYRRGQEPKNTFSHSIRMVEPVTFRGRNRIVAVYHFLNDKNIKVLYGQPLNDFKEKFSRSWGDFDWV